MKCNRCGKENPAEIHTCTPLALKLADVLETNIWAGVCTADERNRAAAELRRLHAENEALRSITKELAVIVKELCACYNHPLPEATIARVGEVK